MKRCEREAVAVIGAILDRHDVQWRPHRGGKHLAVVATLPDGSEHRFTVSGSPRADIDSQRNWCRQEVNAWLDRVGLGSGRGQQARRQRKPHRRARVRSIIHRVEVGGCRLSDDPWAALAGFRLNRD